MGEVVFVGDGVVTVKVVVTSCGETVHHGIVCNFQKYVGKKKLISTIRANVFQSKLSAPSCLPNPVSNR